MNNEDIYTTESIKLILVHKTTTNVECKKYKKTKLIKARVS